jgi:CheY-like chemotaxis protein
MSKTILVVDDEQIIRSVIQRKLEATTSYRVLTCDDGLPALDIVRREHVDLVISDLLMYSLNGIDLLREIKKHDARIPVIIITGYGTLDDAIEAIKLGAEDFIKKPFDIADIILTIDKTFSKLEEQADQRAIIHHIEHEEIKLDIPTDFDFLNRVINYIFSHLRARWIVTAEALHDVKICLYEALYNALEHGSLEISGEEKTRLLEQGQQTYRDFLAKRLADPVYNRRAIHVRLLINDQEMKVGIRDEGLGFEFGDQLGGVPNEEAFKSCGRGLLLITSLMDGVEFNEGGREIVMHKLRSGAMQIAAAQAG